MIFLNIYIVTLQKEKNCGNNACVIKPINETTFEPECFNSAKIGKAAKLFLAFSFRKLKL